MDQTAIVPSNFVVHGVITVVNPDPDNPMTVALRDELDDDETDGVITADADCAFDSDTGLLTIPAGGTAVCDYEALDLYYDDDANAPTLNTAPITLNEIDFDATAGIGWTANVIRGTATLTDDQRLLNVSLDGPVRHDLRGQLYLPTQDLEAVRCGRQVHRHH